MNRWLVVLDKVQLVTGLEFLDKIAEFCRTGLF